MQRDQAVGPGVDVERDTDAQTKVGAVGMVRSGFSLDELEGTTNRILLVQWAVRCSECLQGV